MYNVSRIPNSCIAKYQTASSEFSLQVPEVNGFLTAGRKKNGVVEDELDQSLEGMDHSDDQFDKGLFLY